MRLPVAYEPVKKTPSSGCCSKAAPASAAPTRHTMTSRGTPASCSSRAISSPVSVAYSEGLYNTALPVARAGRITLQPTNHG